MPQVTMRRAALAIGVGIAQSLSLSGRWRGKDEFELERVRCTAGKLLVRTDSVPLLLCFAPRLALPRLASLRLASPRFASLRFTLRGSRCACAWLLWRSCRVVYGCLLCAVLRMSHVVGRAMPSLVREYVVCCTAYVKHAVQPCDSPTSTTVSARNRFSIITQLTKAFLLLKDATSTLPTQ